MTKAFKGRGSGELIVAEGDLRNPGLIADRIVDAIRHVVMDSSFVGHGRAGTLTDEQLVKILTVENSTVDNVTTPLYIAASRFSRTTAGDFLADVVRGVRVDKANCLLASQSIGAPPEGHPGLQQPPEAYAYAGYISWLCLHGGRTSLALLVYVDFVLAHEACVAIVPQLERRAGLPREVIDYFSMYVPRPTGVLDAAVTVMKEGMAAGEDLQEAVDAVAMMGHYLGAFWAVAA
ncbi:hypothetical protein ACFWIA_12445 [Streptomyces sp. NPDC127068]|uniref:hypothetical protein n=1 Tax=Streptomyces sp. NPDC127068 TaxID=3347127 RepID=UPI0036657B74